MKKLMLILLAIVFGLSAFLAVKPQSAQALNGNGYDDTTPPFTLAGTTSVLSPTKMSYGVVTVNDRYFPVWANPGEVEFHYNALAVSGLDGKYTTVKFIFKQWFFGWEGKIYQWNGTKWVALPTKMEVGFEDGGTFATAQVTDGVYALLVWYSGVEKPR